MAQSDIYDLLKNRRLCGDDSYYSVRDIQRMLNGKGISVGNDSVNNNVLKLRVFGFLDMRLDGKKGKNRATYPIAVYRLKKDEIN